MSNRAPSGALLNLAALRWIFDKARPFPRSRGNACDEMGNMFQVYRDFEREVLGARSAGAARSLNPELQTFDQWIAKNKSKIPL